MCFAVNLRVSMGLGLKMLMAKDISSSRKIASSSIYIHENISNISQRVVDDNTNITSQHTVKNASSTQNIVEDVSISKSPQKTVENITRSSRQLVKDKGNFQLIAKGEL